MALVFTNNASGTLASTLNPGDTTAVLNGGEGTFFPLPIGGDTFYATIEDSAGNIEVVSCTARSGDNLTIVRAQEGTAAQTFTAGARFELRVTAAVLNALLQAVTAAATYSPLTHFAPNGLAPETLYNGNVNTEGTATGLGIRRQSGQTSTSASLRNSAGTALANVTAYDSGSVVVENETVSGVIYIRAKNSSSTPTDVFQGNPNSDSRMKHAGADKVVTSTFGAYVNGTNNAAPYNSHVMLRTNNAGTNLAAFGLVSNTNEIRIISYVNGYPVGLYGADTASGTVQPIIVGDPDGALSGYYAGAKRFDTTSAGMTVTGVVTQTGAPTTAQHLTTKTYVDTQIAAVSGSYSAGINGYSDLSGTIRLQWGRVTVGANSSTTVAFPTVFLSAYNVTVTTISSRTNITEGYGNVDALTNSSFRLWNGENGESREFYWQAIGRM